MDLQGLGEGRSQRTRVRDLDLRVNSKATHYIPAVQRRQERQARLVLLEAWLAAHNAKQAGE